TRSAAVSFPVHQLTGLTEGTVRRSSISRFCNTPRCGPGVRRLQRTGREIQNRSQNKASNMERRSFQEKAVCGTMAQSSPGAQTERWGGAGPVRLCLAASTHRPLPLLLLAKIGSPYAHRFAIPWRQHALTCLPRARLAVSPPKGAAGTAL